MSLIPQPEKTQSIKHWAEDDRPREKMQYKGRHALSDAELLAILINTGTKHSSALDLAKQLLHVSGNSLNQLGSMTIDEICSIKGLGMAKAITIAAALELGRRRKSVEAENTVFVKSSKAAYELMLDVFYDLPHEEFWVILLSQNAKYIGRYRISEGNLNATLADPRKIFKLAIQKQAPNIILCHNHPSGNKNPSDADVQLTKKIKEGGKLLDIHVYDHIILTNNGFYSFSDDGKM
jgi:DNA repair protein RadC